MVKKRAKKWAVKVNNYADMATLKLINGLSRFQKYRKRKLGGQKGKGSRMYRRQRGGAIGAGLAIGLGLPMLLQATQGILNSKAF